jgi:hypothetical protein
MQVSKEWIPAFAGMTKRQQPLILYFEVKDFVNLILCSHARFAKLFVTPIYRVPFLQLAII